MHSQRQRGQSLVEIALTIPLLILLVGLSADVARVFAATTQMTNAAREGSLFMAHHFNDPTTGPNANADLLTADAYAKKITSVINAEEGGNLLGCPPGNETVTFHQKGQPPQPPDTLPLSDWTFPPSSSPAQGNYETIDVECSVTPLMTFLPLPNPMHLKATVTTYLFSPQ